MEAIFFNQSSQSTSFRKLRSAKKVKYDLDFDPSESTLPVNSVDVIAGDSSSVQSRSSQCIQRCIVAVDPLKQTGLQKISLKKKLLQNCNFKPAREITADIATAGLSSPKDPSHSFKKQLTNQISLTRTTLKNATPKQVESPLQLPKIVALISVKKPVCKSKKLVKMSLPKKDSIKKILPNLSTSEVVNKVQTSLQITTKKQFSSKKVLKKALSNKETLSKRPKPEVDKNEEISEVIEPNEVKLKKLRKPLKVLKSKSLLSKVTKRKRTSQEANTGTIPCSECDRMFVSFRSRARHFRLHKVAMTYSCSDCPKTFKNRSSFLSHANTHNKIGWITCSLCPAKFAWPNTFRAHLLCHVGKLKDPLRCLQCSKKFWYQQTWEQHVKRGRCRKKEPKQRTTFECDVCQKLLTTRGNLKKHLAMHQGLKPFVCKTCGVRFTAQSSLNEHARIHSGNRPFVCHICGKSFAQSSGFRQHLAIHNGECQFVCKFCNKGFKLNRYLVKHMDTMHVDENKYNCHLCGKLFKLGDYLRRHIKAVHSADKDAGSARHRRKTAAADWESDGTDGYSSAGMSGGEQDEETETVNEAVTEGENLGRVAPYNDEENAGVGFALEDTVEQAIEKLYDKLGDWNQDTLEKFGHGALDNVDQGALESCEASAKTLGGEGNGQESDLYVDGHVVLHVMQPPKPSCSVEAERLQYDAIPFEESAEEDVPDDLPPIVEKRSRHRPFPCSVCSKSFRKQKTLEAHMGSHSQDRPYECDVCRHRFNTKQEVRRHLKSHGVYSADKLRCSSCGKVHLRLVDRERHICGVTRMYGCTKCGAKFERRQQFHQHVADAHKASLECKQCGKFCTTSWNLKKHMAVHIGDKPFVCEVCGARFTANQSLKVHAARHATQDRRLYVCSVCAKTFTQKSSMKQHEMLHDKEPRHKCPYCEKSFKVGSYLRRHIAVLHTVEKRFFCNHCGKRFGLRSVMLIHERSHREHMRLQCEDCDKTFSHKRYLRKHTKKEHGCEGDAD